MIDVEKVAQCADFIVNGYAFIFQDGSVRILNLNNPVRAVVLDKDGNVMETSMDDIEISIVRVYWERNKEFAPQTADRDEDEGI